METGQRETLTMLKILAVAAVHVTGNKVVVNLLLGDLGVVNDNVGMLVKEVLANIDGGGLTGNDRKMR